MPESRYIAKKLNPVPYGGESKAGLPELPPGRPPEFAARWTARSRAHLSKFVPYLTKRCGLEIRGRVLEIGAGIAWFSAEISKLPAVVEVVATDVSARRLQEEAPQMFKLLGAREAKITRMPADFYRLDFPDNHFDFVVCSALLNHGVNVPQVLREARRVLKSGGRFIAIREPVKPLVKSARTPKSIVSDRSKPFYSLDEYKQFFTAAGLDLGVKRVNLSSGFKYYFNQIVNGLTHVRCALVGTKVGKL
jgi:ubiquinone/menaquinone biosynthesis C-methylase UbiE